MKALINDPRNHLIDVRTAQEVAEVSVKGAKHIALDTVTERVDDFKEMAKTGALILFCRSGARSGRAMEFLKQQGISNVHNGGGYAEVQAQQE